MDSRFEQIIEDSAEDCQRQYDAYDEYPWHLADMVRAQGQYAALYGALAVLAIHANVTDEKTRDQSIRELLFCLADVGE